MTFDPFAATIDDARAEAERRLQRRKQGLPLSAPAPAPDRAAAGQPAPSGRVIDPAERGELEKKLEAEGDKLVLAMGGRVIRFSHAGRTKQTPGISDRLYCFPRVGLAVWWEWKTPENKQRPDQRDFEETVTACGHLYAWGGLGDFRAWLAERGVCTFDAEGRPIPNP